MLAINQKGDTIVEVLIALAVIGSVIITSSLAVDSIATSNRNNYLRQQAVQVLQNQMELVKAANMYLPEYSLNNIFTTYGNSTFCTYVTSSPVVKFNIYPLTLSGTPKCHFDQTGVTNGSTGFYDIKLNLVQDTISKNYYNLQGEIDWTSPGQPSNNNVKFTYELVSNN